MTLLKKITLINIAFLFLAFQGNAQDQHEILIGPVKFAANNKAAYSELVVLNEHWDTLQYKKFDRLFITNFMRWQTPKGIRYTYYLQDTNAYVPKGMTYTSGHIYVTDARLNIIKKISLLPHGHVKKGTHAADAHDFIYFGKDHYIVIGYYEETPNNIPASLHPATGVTVLSSVIQEVKNGRVIWQWDGTDHPELYAASHVNNNFSDTNKTQDYLHVNALFIDPNDNNLLVSCKNTNQVLKIDRKTGNILWRLGGKDSDFALTNEQQFIHQHHVTITTDNTLLFFDNGDENTRPQSRIVELKLDEEKRTITSYYSIKIESIFTPSAGSVQKFGDTYFVSTGTTADVLIIDRNTGKVLFKKHLPYTTYRALKY
jgi:arylsulfate sulfotransferase